MLETGRRYKSCSECSPHSRGTVNFLFLLVRVFLDRVCFLSFFWFAHLRSFQIPGEEKHQLQLKIPLWMASISIATTSFTSSLEIQRTSSYPKESRASRGSWFKPCITSWVEQDLQTEAWMSRARYQVNTKNRAVLRRWTGEMNRWESLDWRAKNVLVNMVGRTSDRGRTQKPH